MIEELLAGAEPIRKEVPRGAYEGEPPPEVKATVQELLSSISGTMNRRQLAGYEAPKARVSPRGTVQLVWERPYGGLALAVREWDQGGSVGIEWFPKGDVPPDPELSTSQPMGHVISEVVAWMSR
jgi:hypothetical protein